MKKRTLLIALILVLAGLIFSSAYAGKKNVVRIAWNETPQVGMNPFPARKAGDYIFLNLIYEPLCMPMMDGTVRPWIAKSWDYNEEEDTWTFHLDERAKWSDGKPLTAKDVKFTFETLYKYKFPMGATTKAFVESVQAVDDHTVRFKMKSPFAAFVPTAGGTLIMPEHIWSKIDKIDLNQNANPVGSGPFLFKTFKPRAFLHLVKDDDYWRGPVHIDEVVIQVYLNAEAQIVALKKGEIDIQPGMSAYSLLQPLIDDPNVEVLIDRTPYNFYIAPNHRIYPINLKEFRKAIDLAVDRKTITEVAMAGYAELPLMGYVAPVVTKWVNNKCVWRGLNMTEEARMREANAILDGLGFKRGKEGVRETKEGKKLEFRVRVVTSPSYIRACEIIKENLAQIGIKLNIRVTEPKSLYGAFIYSGKHQEDWDLFVHGSFMNPDPDHLARVWAPEPPHKWANAVAFGWVNDDIQTLLKQSRREVDEEKRKALLLKAQERFGDELVVITLAHRYNAAAHRTDKYTGWNKELIFYGAMYHPLAGLQNLTSLRPK